MKKQFVVKGENWALQVDVDTETFSGDLSYFEAVTMAFECMFRSREENVSVLWITNEFETRIDIESEFTLEDWRNSEGSLPAPEIGEYFTFVKRFDDTEFTAVETKAALLNAGLPDIIEELEAEEV